MTAAPARPRAPDPRRRGRLVAGLVLLSSLALAGAGGWYLWNRASSPRIDSLDPVLAEPGGVVTIVGRNFGPTRGESRVELDGIAPTSSSYLRWSEDRVAVRLPPSARSGLVYVVTAHGRSNPKLFMNRSSLPIRARGPSAGGSGPFIASLSRDAGPVGSLVVISGRSFGQNRDEGAVLFSWSSDASPVAPGGGSEPLYVSGAEGDLGYELWSDKEIRVRVPDGAASGALVVRTAAGSSNALFFSVTGAPGEKRYASSRTYSLAYTVNITKARSSGPNELYLWVPKPASAASQRVLRVLSQEPPPLVPDFRGTALHRVKDLATGQDLTVTQSYLVQVNAIETRIEPDRIQRPEDPPKLVAALTAPDELVPSGAPEIQGLARRIVGSERNPWRAARLVNDWLAKNLAWAELREPRKPVEALAARSADSWSYALVATALLRAAGVPAQPVAGYLVDPSRRAVRHAWVEFWIYGLGWLPMDPILASGARPGGLPPAFEDPARYFGNLDDRRLAFSRGVATISPMTQGGRRSSPTRPYSYQSFFEEASGALDAYSSFWSEVEVTGLY